MGKCDMTQTLAQSEYDPNSCEAGCYTTLRLHGTPTLCKLSYFKVKTCFYCWIQVKVRGKVRQG